MKIYDKILLGIYSHFPRLDDDITFETGELAWIVHYGLNGWQQDKERQKIEYTLEKEPNDKFSLYESLKDRSKVAKELSFLQANDYIEFQRPSGFGNHFRVKLLPKGIIRAEKLSSKLGEIELWYSENKDGIFGLVWTIIISIITAWITTKIATKSG